MIGDLKKHTINQHQTIKQVNPRQIKGLTSLHIMMVIPVPTDHYIGRGCHQGSLGKDQDHQFVHFRFRWTINVQRDVQDTDCVQIPWVMEWVFCSYNSFGHHRTNKTCSKMYTLGLAAHELEGMI